MKITSIAFLISVGLFAATPCMAERKDAANCKDHPLINRLPDYWIEVCTLKQFDAYGFMVGKDKPVQVEGRFAYIGYQPPAGLTDKPSALQVMRNVENAIKQVGGKAIWSTTSGTNKETMTLTKDGKELWIEVWADWTGKYRLTIVEKEAMQQQLVANADAFANSLKTTGHIAVEGIYFDTGKAELKPESAQAIAEVAKLLQGEADLKLYVVGHTDNAGALEGNMKLSQGRAQAVVQALVKSHGIGAARIKAYGSGPYAPVASNDTEEGRAQNRRVELVKQ